jgi:regulation of enolase protein 1 (concanavalin A-like superfamily)
MMRFIGYFALIAGLIGVSCSSNPTLAGGAGTETTNAKVSGAIVCSNGSPSVNATVRLRRSDYVTATPSLAKAALYGADAVTDDSGRFEITGIDPGSYRIEVTDGHAAVLLACSLDIHDTVNLGTATLQPFATLIGAADTTGRANPQIFAQVAGLERLAVVGIDGRYSLADLPQGIFSLHVGSNASGAATTIIDGVQAVAADTAVVRSPLPAPWTGVSIGYETPAGGAMYTNGRFTITGGGPDIWLKADGFFFVYQPWSGDGSITAHITDFDYVRNCAKAGLMFRETLDSSSVTIQASIEIDSLGVHALVVHSRRVTAALSTWDCTVPPYRVPQWVRLARAGDVFTALVSTDGAVWTAACADTVAMARDLYVGFNVTSHDTTRLSYAVFESVTVR